MLTCSVLLWRGRNPANKCHWHVWGVLAVSQPHWVCPRSLRVCFHGLHFQALGCSARELSAVSPGLGALPRSKPLRFRFLGTPQWHRLGWACVLCPSQVRAVQVTRCVASTVSPRWRVRLITSCVPATWFSGWLWARFSQVCRVSLLGSWSLAATLLADVNLPESQEVFVSNGACLQFGRGCLCGAAIAPFQLWLPPTPTPACLSPVGHGPVRSQVALLWYLLSPLFCERAWQCLRFGLFAG